MQKDSLQNRNGVVKTIAEWEAEAVKPVEVPTEPVESPEVAEELGASKQKKRK